jgi:hypothetical protein
LENKLRHIDELLRNSLGQYDDAVSLDSDWLAVEKKLKHRKNRIFAMWFSLALVGVMGGSAVFVQLNQSKLTVSENDTEIQSNEDYQTKDKDLSSGHRDIENESDERLSGNQAQASGLNQTDSEVSGLDKSKDELQSDKENSLRQTGSLPDLIRAQTNPLPPSTTLLILPPAIDRIASRGGINFMWHNPLDIIPLREINVDKSLADFSNSSSGKKASGFELSHKEIGLSFTPSLADKFISENGEHSGLINRGYNSKVLNNEFVSPAYNIGLNYEWHFGNGMFLGTGFGLTQRTENVQYNYVVDEAPFLSADNSKIEFYLPINPFEVNYQGSNSYHFIDIPLTIGFTNKYTGRVNIRYQMDVSYLLLTNRLGYKGDYLTLELQDLRSLSYYRQSNIAITLKTGIYFNFKTFVIGAEPVFSTNLNSLTNRTSAIQIKPYSYGLNITTNMKLFR